MLLTIGIPVYNSEKFLEKVIKNISLANFDWKNVEIIVSDNNSTDSSCNIVEKYSNIKLYRHDENVGYDRNIDRIFRYAQGRYVWTIGSDDLLTTQDVSEINTIISSKDSFSVIFAGESKAEKYGVMNSADSFLYASDFRSGFISNNIINKNLWLKSNSSEFYDTGWIHFGMVLKLLLEEPSYILNKCYVTEIEESKHNKSWIKGGQGLLIGLNLVEIFHRIDFYGYSLEMRKMCKLVIRRSYPNFIIYSKCLGLKINLKILKNFISLFKEFPSFWLIDFPILIIPGFIFVSLFKSYKLIKKYA
jgi:glycosyltransferase involved in cell wall biosynthesis